MGFNSAFKGLKFTGLLVPATSRKHNRIINIPSTEIGRGLQLKGKFCNQFRGIFPHSKTSKLALEPNQLPIQWVPGFLLGINEADPFPYMPSWCRRRRLPLYLSKLTYNGHRNALSFKNTKLRYCNHVSLLVVSIPSQMSPIETMVLWDVPLCQLADDYQRFRRKFSPKAIWRKKVRTKSW